MTAYTHISFKNYRLSIFNNHEVISISNHSLINLIGARVVSVKESLEEIIISFENNDAIRIDLDDSAFNDPESLVLYGPNNLIVVWN